MPALLQRYFPSPVDRAKLLTAIHAIQELGPLAVRRAAPQVIADLKESPRVIDSSDSFLHLLGRQAHCYTGGLTRRCS